MDLAMGLATELATIGVIELRRTPAQSNSTLPGATPSARRAWRVWRSSVPGVVCCASFDLVDESSVVRRRIASVAVVYGALGLAAILWSSYQGHLPYQHPAPWLEEFWLHEFWAGWGAPASLMASLIGGLLLAWIVVKSTKGLVSRTRWARELHHAFREALSPARSSEILFFASASGIAEELFFRGAMQPAIGWILSAAIFGAVHVGPGTRFLPWTLWAAAMGLAFGALHAATGHLWGAVVAHVVINYENMHFIVAHDPPSLADASERKPTLVQARLRNGGKVR